MDGAAPVRYGLLLCNDATVGVLKKELSALSGIPVYQLIIVETFGPIISVSILVNCDNICQICFDVTVPDG